MVNNPVDVKSAGSKLISGQQVDISIEQAALPICVPLCCGLRAGVNQQE